MKNFTSILIALLLITGCANAPKETSTKLTLGLVQSTVTKGANQSEIVIAEKAGRFRLRLCENLYLRVFHWELK